MSPPIPTSLTKSKRPISFIRPQPRPRPLRKTKTIEGNHSVTYIRIIFKLGKEHTIKDQVLEDTKALFINGDGYCKFIKTRSTFNHDSVESESNGDWYTNFSLAGYLDEVSSSLKSLIRDLKETTNTWEIYVTIKTIFRFSKDNGKGREIFWKSENILVRVGDSAKNLMIFLEIYFELSRKHGWKDEREWSYFRLCR